MTKYYRILFMGIVFLSACTSGEEEASADKQVQSRATKPEQKHPYFIYLESSGSLYGYLNAPGDNDFNSVVMGLLTHINTSPDKEELNLYDINTAITPAVLDVNARTLSNYYRDLNLAALKERSKKNKADITQSNLGEVFKKILDTLQANGISILVSDCIFSPGTKGDASAYLNREEQNMQLFVSEQLNKRQFSTLVLQFYSDFDGIYYYQNNSDKNGYFKNRPYYIVCFGEEQALYKLLQYAGRPEAKGFKNYLFLTTAKTYTVTPVIRTSEEYYEYDPEHQLLVTDAHRGGKDDRFRIKIKVDFSSLPVGENYLTDPVNYKVEPDYTLESVKQYRQEKSTHELTLVRARPQTGKVRIALKKQLPAWIITANLDADKGLPVDSLEGKTFGIRYLLNGMYNAYANYSPAPEYFNLTISVKD